MSFSFTHHVDDSHIGRAEGTTANEQAKRLPDLSPTIGTAISSPSQNATETLFQQWDVEDANMAPEERQAEDRFWEAFAAGIDSTRREAGMRLLFESENK